MPIYRMILAATIALAAGFFGCGGGSDGGGSEDGLTETDINAISAALTEAFGGMSNDYASAGLVLNPSALTSEFPLNGETACQRGGRITWTGNATVTVPDEGETGPSTAYLLVTYQVSDPTNNLNDCEVADGVILDGTLTLTMTVEDADYSASLTGTIGVNERGPTGGLVPLASECFIFLRYTNTGTSGSICGRSVSS